LKKTYTKTATIYIDGQLDGWLNAKVEKGYKKGALIRHILEEQMRWEQSQKKG